MKSPEKMASLTLCPSSNNSVSLEFDRIHSDYMVYHFLSFCMHNFLFYIKMSYCMASLTLCPSSNNYVSL